MVCGRAKDGFLRGGCGASFTFPGLPYTSNLNEHPLWIQVQQNRPNTPCCLCGSGENPQFTRLPNGPVCDACVFDKGIDSDLFLLQEGCESRI